MKRACFIDHLKMVLCALVIIHHAAIAYGALGGWCYLAPEPIRGIPQIALSTLLAVNQAFFMSLFFFISAYLMPESLARKGAGPFLKDRVVRLGIPLLVYTRFMSSIQLLSWGRPCSLNPFSSPRWQNSSS